MMIGMTSAIGFIGKHFDRVLRQQKHKVIKLEGADSNSPVKYLSRAMSNSGAVVNLTCTPINRRWTAAYKRDGVQSSQDNRTTGAGVVTTCHATPSDIDHTVHINYGTLVSDHKSITRDLSVTSHRLHRLALAIRLIFDVT